MKVSIVKNVNIRSTAGTSLPPVGAHLSGTDIEVTRITPGDSIEGNSIWYKTETGNYVWSGAGDKVQLANSIGINPNQWHLIHYSIPQLWQKYGSKGDGVKVAVIDTGIIQNYTDYFGGNIILTKCFSNSGNVFDNGGHGSHCAGIIGAIGTKDNLWGLAPNCKILTGKVYDDDGTTARDFSYFDKAIRFFSADPTYSVDIISLSQGFFSDNNNVFSEAIKFATQPPNNVIVIAAAGDDPTSVSLYVPASISPTLPIGAIDENEDTKNSTVASTLVKIYAPGVNIYSIGIPAIRTGTSQATPFIAGLLALGLSLIKQQNNSKFNKSDLIPVLIRTGNTVRDTSTNSIITTVNPDSFLNTLNS